MRDDEKLQQHIADIGTRYLKRTLGELAQLRDCLQEIRNGSGAAIQELARFAHKIHGSGAMFGFDAISERADELERLANFQNATPEGVDKLEACIAALEQEVVNEARARGVE